MNDQHFQIIIDNILQFYYLWCTKLKNLKTSQTNVDLDALTFSKNIICLTAYCEIARGYYLNEKILIRYRVLLSFKWYNKM